MSFYSRNEFSVSHHAIERAKQRLNYSGSNLEIELRILKDLDGVHFEFETRTDYYFEVPNKYNYYFVVSKNNSLVITVSRISYNKKLSLNII